MISFLSFAYGAGIGRGLYSSDIEKPPANKVLLALVIFLTAFTFFFTRYSDIIKVEKDEQYETTYGVIYLKYRR